MRISFIIIVFFQDGSYTTFQKAKLMNVHLVSVLWIEAVRSSGTRVSEKQFPALGTAAYDHNVSKICSVSKIIALSKNIGDYICYGWCLDLCKIAIVS